MRLAFVGAGKMATAIARGLVENDVWPVQQLAAADVSAEARHAFSQNTGVTCAAEAATAIRDADVVVLAVKPQVAADVAEPLAQPCAGKLVISIAAGIRLQTVAHWFGMDRVVRVMPNTPLTIGMGSTAFTCGNGVSAADRDIVEKIFGTVGMILETSEEAMDAVTAVSGSGPAYVFEFIRALADAGEQVGLPPATALQLTLQTVAGATEMVRHGLGSPEELRDAVTSPGGTTAAGLHVMQTAKFHELIENVVRAARDRSVELGSR